MAQFARPSSDVAAGSWTGQDDGTTNLFGYIDEASASDTDYVRSLDNSITSLECHLSDPTDPAVHTGHTVRYRYRKSASGGHSLDLIVELVQGTTVIASQTHTGVTSLTFIDGSFTLTTGEAANITDYSDLRLRFTRSGETGGSPSGRRSLHVSWGELEVPDALLNPTLDASSGSFTISGATAFLGVDSKVEAAVGAFSLSGQDSALRSSREVSASPATVVLSGQITGLVLDGRFDADPGSIVVTGDAALLIGDFRVSAETAAVTVAGQDVDFLAGARLTAQAGTFTLTGDTALLIGDFKVSAETDSVSITGQDVGFNVGATVAADSGDVSLSGTDVGFSRTGILSAESGSTTLTGSTASLLRLRHVEAEAGSLQWLGQAAALLLGALIGAQSGQVQIVETDAGLDHGSLVSAESGDLHATGFDVTFVRGANLSVESGSVTWIGSPADLLTQNPIFGVDSGSFVISGTNVLLLAMLPSRQSIIVDQSRFSMRLEGSRRTIIVDGESI